MEQGWGGRAGQVPVEETGRHCFHGAGEWLEECFFSTWALVCVHANTCVCGLVTRSSEVLRFRWWVKMRLLESPLNGGLGALGFAQLLCCGQPSVWHVRASTLMPCRGLGSGCPSGEHTHEAMSCLRSRGTWAQQTPKAELVCPLPACLPCSFLMGPESQCATSAWLTKVRTGSVLLLSQFVISRAVLAGLRYGGSPSKACCVPDCHPRLLPLSRVGSPAQHHSPPVSQKGTEFVRSEAGILGWQQQKPEATGVWFSVTVETLRKHHYSFEDVGEHPSRSCLLSL